MKFYSTNRRELDIASIIILLALVVNIIAWIKEYRTVGLISTCIIIVLFIYSINERKRQGKS